MLLVGSHAGAVSDSVIPGDDAGRRFKLSLRWGFLAFVLLLEVLGLSVRFDSGSLANRSVWWARWLSETPSYAAFVVTSLLASLLFCFRRISLIRDQLLIQGERHRSWWVYFVAQLLAFAALVYCTHILFEAPQGIVHWAWPIAWIVVAGLSLVLWLGAVAPLDEWLKLIRQEWRALASGAAVGGTAILIGQSTQMLWSSLSGLTFNAVEMLLVSIYPDLATDPLEKIIGTRTFKVRVHETCSGYEGIGLIWVFLAAFLWLFRQQLRFPQAWLLFPIGTLTIWAANVVRIAGLIVIGTSFSPAVAAGGFHSQAGWLAFNLVVFALLAMAFRSPYFSRIERVECDRPMSPSAAYVMPLMVLVLTMMITGAFAEDVDWLYPVRVLTAMATLWYFRSELGRLTWSSHWLAVLIGGLVFVLWLALEPPGTTGPSPLGRGLREMPGTTALAWIAARVIGSVLIVPLVEELALRGYLMRRIDRPDFENLDYRQVSWRGIAVTSLAFGLMHERWLAGTIAGVFYAYAVCRSGRLSDAVVAHATTNALIAVWVLSTGQWHLWL
jgi:exosortase E/protease (VPEID-CTERM system)